MRVVETPEMLESMLLEYWNVRAVHLQALSSGHTNKTYRVHHVARAAILRVSWPGKTLAQIERETMMLTHLSGRPHLPALPRLLPTLSGQPGAQAAHGGWLHLFESIDGEPGMPDDARRAAIVAMRTLAQLHAAMATLRAHDAGPLAWLQARHARVAARQTPDLNAALLPQYSPLMACMEALLAQAAEWVDDPAQWLHGDYHAGNLLFEGQMLAGVIDFDDVGQGSRWLEAAFALFALSRDSGVEERFVFDESIWRAGLEAYAGTSAEEPPGWLRARSVALMRLFCTDQVLIHLEAAQRGLWSPGPGMGFLACWRELLGTATRSDLPVGVAQK
jgi:Ser/Thr protein kinase RdoA (MazF antagonist)